MTLTTLATLRHKLEKAERVLADRAKQLEGAYVIVFSGDTEEEIEVKRKAVLGDLDPKKFKLAEILFMEGEEGFVLPGHGDTSNNQPGASISISDEIQGAKNARGMDELREDDEEGRKQERQP